LTERTHGSAKAFTFGLLAGSRIVFTPANATRNESRNVVSRGGRAWGALGETAGSRKI